MMSLDSVPVREHGIVGQVVDNEAVLVLPEKGEIKVLNEVGARIWELLDGMRSIREIAAALHAEYDVALAQAEGDTLDFITELASRQMVS
jgi:hypothetical protein